MGCSQTTGAAPLVSLSHSSPPHTPEPAQFCTFFFFFLLFSPVVITIVLQLRDNEERGILAMRRAINLLVY